MFEFCACRDLALHRNLHDSSLSSSDEGFGDHDNLLAKLEETSSEVLADNLNRQLHCALTSRNVLKQINVCRLIIKCILYNLAYFVEPEIIQYGTILHLFG